MLPSRAFAISTFVGLCLYTPAALAQSVLVDETFADLSDWQDLSTALTWGSQPPGTSGFETVGGVVRLTTTALANTGYSSTTSLKTFSALDYQFATPVDHATNVITIDFRARWPKLDTNSGEKNRFNITLVHDYPAGGLSMAVDDTYDDLTAHWWGRPAYQVRIRGSKTANGKTILQYGGGMDVLGEWEFYNSSWWLAGFNSAPGGGSPGSSGQGWVLTDTGIASSAFRNYRYVIYPDRHEIWADDDGDGQFDANDLRGTQDLLSDPANPSWFYYFENLEGVRLYWRGAGSSGNVELDWLRITVAPAS